jgi:Ca-activated chloride channel family protein
MTRPVFASIAINLGGSDVNRTYPRDIPDLFEGGQLVWVGRYQTSGKATVKLNGRVGGEHRSFEFPTELAAPGSSTKYDFVEKLWAIRRVGFIIDQVDLNGPNKELIDELVALGAKYGLLTPYTSFLADERTNLHASLDNRTKAGKNLESLQIVQGEAGTAQRGMKRNYQNAERLEEVSKYASTSAPAKPGMMGGMGGMGGAIPTKPGEPAKATGPTVRNLGAKTFYRKADRWVDSDVKPEEDAKAIVVEQFSDQFFELARGQSAEQNQYLTFEEPVTVRISGKVYRVDPPKAR